MLGVSLENSETGKQTDWPGRQRPAQPSIRLVAGSFIGDDVFDVDDDGR